MKRLVFAAALLCGVLFAAEPVREIKVLTIGNSFANSVMGALRQVVAADPSCKIKIVGANLGGCSLERHWNNFAKSEKDPSFKPYAGNKKSLQELLAEDKWDIVTIQQASRLSWKPESYQPFADNLIAAVRKLAPNAEIVIQQTWSYNSAMPRLNPGDPKSWKIDQTAMYEKLTAAYLQLAKKHQLRVIPVGDAVQIFRKTMGDKLVACEPKDISGMQKPDLPKTNDVAGNFSWTTDKKTGKEKLFCDYCHLNKRGCYLQALVWYAVICGKDPARSKFVPKNISAEEVALFKKCASEAVKKFPQVNSN